MNVKKVGLSLPKLLVAEIDQKRGDIGRSKFIMRLLQKSLNTMEKIVKVKVKVKKKGRGNGFQPNPSVEIASCVAIDESRHNDDDTNTKVMTNG